MQCKHAGWTAANPNSLKSSPVPPPPQEQDPVAALEHQASGQRRRQSQLPTPPTRIVQLPLDARQDARHAVLQPLGGNQVLQLRLALGLVGVALLVALLFVSVFVGIAMLAAGMLFRLFRQRRTPMAVRAGSIDADYRVVGKAQLPLAH